MVNYVIRVLIGFVLSDFIKFSPGRVSFFCYWLSVTYKSRCVRLEETAMKCKLMMLRLTDKNSPHLVKDQKYSYNHNHSSQIVGGSISCG